MIVAAGAPIGSAAWSAPFKHSGREGPAVEAPDFNGDGYGDVAVSALYEDVGAVTDAGSVNVLYGSSNGIQATAPANQLWTQDSPGVEGEGEPGAQVGFCTTSGDFNGDGYGDLAICVPYLDVNGVTDAGAMEVLYGSAAGLQSDGIGGPDDQLWTQDSPGVQGVAETVDAFARSAAAGDLNGDGYGDLAIDIRGEPVDGQAEAGAVAVLYGSGAGLQADARDDQLWTQNSPGVQEQAEAHDWFGRNLATGDVNGDGYDDLAAGDFLEDLGSLNDAGAVEVLYGSAAGLQADGTGGPDDQIWTQDSPGVRDFAEAGDYFGHTVALADFNGDGFADLAVSSRLEDVSNRVNAGGVEVLYGTTSGLKSDSPEDRFWTQDSQGVLGQTGIGAEFGFSLAVGDFNADGFSDLAIGAPFKNSPPNPKAGEMAILHGSAIGLQATAPDDQLWNQDSPDVEDQVEPKDTFGISLGAGDFNGDGVSDVGVGVGHESLDALPYAGALAVLYGANGAGLQAVSPDDQVWTQDSADVQDQAEPNDQFGWWVW